MRIISGYLGGRKIESPKNSHTHPMSDKMRGALFNALGDIEGLSVLDAFAGSGALGLEAISRGASHATFIENDRSAQLTIDRNIHTLRLENQTKNCKTNVIIWLRSNPKKTFDVVLCDPPYDDVQLLSLQRLADSNSAGGIFVLSWPGKAEAPRFTTLDSAVQKKYGDSQLILYRKKST